MKHYMFRAAAENVSPETLQNCTNEALHPYADSLLRGSAHCSEERKHDEICGNLLEPVRSDDKKEHYHLVARRQT